LILLLFGKERFLKDEAVADLKKKIFLSPSELDLNFQSFDAEEHGIHAALDFLWTAPFLAAKRVALVRNVDALAEEDGKRLLKALQELPSTACLVLETEQTNTKKPVLLRDLAEKAETVACHTPFDSQLPAWVENHSKKKKLALERGAAAALINRVGADLGMLAGALNELALYVHPRLSASIADVQAITPSNPEEDVFNLADLLLQDRKKEALVVMDGLFRSGARAPEIVGALAGQLERFKKARTMVSVGRPESQIAEEMRVPRFVQAQFFQRLKGLSESRLRRMQKALLDCDESFKTGRAQERVSVERFVLST